MCEQQWQQTECQASIQGKMSAQYVLPKSPWNQCIINNLNAGVKHSSLVIIWIQFPVHQGSGSCLNATRFMMAYNKADTITLSMLARRFYSIYIYLCHIFFWHINSCLLQSKQLLSQIPYKWFLLGLNPEKCAQMGQDTKGGIKKRHNIQPKRDKEREELKQ